MPPSPQRERALLVSLGPNTKTLKLVEPVLRSEALYLKSFVYQAIANIYSCAVILVLMQP